MNEVESNLAVEEPKTSSSYWFFSSASNGGNSNVTNNVNIYIYISENPILLFLIMLFAVSGIIVFICVRRCPSKDRLIQPENRDENSFYEKSIGEINSGYSGLGSQENIKSYPHLMSRYLSFVGRKETLEIILQKINFNLNLKKEIYCVIKDGNAPGGKTFLVNEVCYQLIERERNFERTLFVLWIDGSTEGAIIRDLNKITRLQLHNIKFNNVYQKFLFTIPDDAYVLIVYDNIKEKKLITAILDQAKNKKFRHIFIVESGIEYNPDYTVIVDQKEDWLNLYIKEQFKKIYIKPSENVQVNPSSELDYQKSSTSVLNISNKNNIKKNDDINKIFILFREYFSNGSELLSYQFSEFIIYEFKKSNKKNILSFIQPIFKQLNETFTTINKDGGEFSSLDKVSQKTFCMLRYLFDYYKNSSEEGMKLLHTAKLVLIFSSFIHSESIPNKLIYLALCAQTSLINEKDVDESIRFLKEIKLLDNDRGNDKNFFVIYKKIQKGIRFYINDFSKSKYIYPLIHVPFFIETWINIVIENILNFYYSAEHYQEQSIVHMEEITNIIASPSNNNLHSISSSKISEKLRNELASVLEKNQNRHKGHFFLSTFLKKSSNSPATDQRFQSTSLSSLSGGVA